MRIRRIPYAIGLATLVAATALGVTQASAQNVLTGSAGSRAAASAKAPMSPTSLKWVRNAIAEYKAHHASTRIKPAITIGDFSSCPALPAGDDPSSFLCLLIHITGGQLDIGRSNQIINQDINVPFAEGSDASGNIVLVPGTLQSEPMPVLGGIFLDPLVESTTRTDPNLQLSVKPVGVGIAADPTGNTAAIISQKIQAINPIFGNVCFIGSNANPVVLDPTFGTTSPPPPNQPISGGINSIQQLGNELVIIGTVVDNAFAGPRAQGCGPAHSLNSVVNEVSGLPAKAGTNTAIFQVTVEAINYSNIGA